MIQITQYQPDMFDLLCGLHESNNTTTDILAPDTLPKIGYIATEGSIPVAMGFLRLVEGGFAQIDTLVTNADLPPETRHQGLEPLIDQLIQTAKQKKLKGIISFTSDMGVIKRAVDTGFKVTSQAVIVLPLGG